MRARPPDGEAAIAAYAASVAARCILQNLVIEPELDREGRPWGLQTACPASKSDAEGDQEDRADPLHHRHGERSARNQPRRDVTWGNVHPADQFEAFKKLAEERGFGAERSPPASA